MEFLGEKTVCKGSVNTEEFMVALMNQSAVWPLQPLVLSFQWSHCTHTIQTQTPLSFRHFFLLSLACANSLAFMKSQPAAPTEDLTLSARLAARPLGKKKPLGSCHCSSIFFFPDPQVVAFLLKNDLVMRCDEWVL